MISCTLYSFLVAFGQSLNCTPGYALKKLKKNNPRHCQQSINTVYTYMLLPHGFMIILLTDQLAILCKLTGCVDVK